MKNIQVKRNPDDDFVENFRQLLKDSNGYCPCRLEKTPDTKCMCKEFRELLENDDFTGPCHCGYYIKEIIE